MEFVNCGDGVQVAECGDGCLISSRGGLVYLDKWPKGLKEMREKCAEKAHGAGAGKRKAQAKLDQRAAAAKKAREEA